MIIKFGKPQNSKLRALIRTAIIIRLVILIAIACSGNWEASFIGKGISDDWKYEMGAVLFEKNASNILDVKTFTWAFNSLDSTDWTGYHLANPISDSVLWYLIVCLLVWITKTKYSIRILNIILAAISLKYIYNFANRIWGENVASKAVKLFTYLPYPVVFCCFGYKEELVLFCTFYLLSHSVDYRIDQKFQISGIVKMILVAVLLMGIRSGISLILFAVCLAIMFIPEPSRSTKLSKKKLMPFILMLIIMVIAFIRFGGAIIYKAGRYFGGKGGGTDTISILMINRITDIWKLPFSYMFSIIMPISLFKPLDSWLSLIDNLNIIMVPISVGCMLYLVMKRKSSKIVYWGTFAYYLIYVITSLNYFRQYASLLPLNLIYYSAFSINTKVREKHVFYIGTGLMIIALIVFYIL